MSTALSCTLTYGVVGLDVEVGQLEDPGHGAVRGGGGRLVGRDLVQVGDVQHPGRGPGGSLAAPDPQHHAADVATGQAVLKEAI